MSILYFRNSDGKFVQIPSIPGKSAYEIAVEKGVFQGTEEEFAQQQIFDNKDILDQITQENIDLWNEGGNIDLTPYATIEYVDEALEGVDVTEQLQEYAKLTDLDGLFDDVALNEQETTDMQTAIDFYSNGEVVKTVYFSGGSGGGGATSAYISTILEENLIVNTGENFNLILDFVSPNLGKGTLKVFINDVDAVTKSIGQGESTTPISGDLFSKGQNKVVVYVLDRVGVMSNSLTFYVRYGSLEIISDFDTYSSYDYGSIVRYYFTPIAVDTSLALTMYMSIDGQTQTGVSCTSDTRGYFTFPSNLSVGNHLCKAWVQDSNGSSSNELVFNLIILNDTALVVATDTHNTVSIEEGEQLSLDYKVYMKGNSTFNVYVYVDNNQVSTGTCGLTTSYYKTSSLPLGLHTVKVEVFDTTNTVSDYITWTVNITESSYEMKTPVTAGATFIASAKNKSNQDENREVWIGTDQDGNSIEVPLSDFSWNEESGWVNDQLIISGNSYAEIPIKPLATNAKYGFTLDVEFLTRPIGVEDALVLDLWDEENNCGIKITTEELIMQSKAGNRCDLYFEEDTIVSAMFVIDRNEGTAKIYLDGVMCEAFHLTDYTANGVDYLEDFTVDKNIKLGGSGYCAIRNIRTYQVALTTNEIINNFISNKIVKSEQRELVEFQKGTDLPTMTIYCDFSGLGKDDKKPCNISYVSTDVNKYGESFTLDGKYSQLQYQGTSSMAYPIKNYRINPRDKNGKKKINPFIGGKPESRFTLKADFITSNHAHNTGMAKFISDKLYNYNDEDESTMNPMRWYLLQNGGDVNTVRETINGFPIRLILVNDGSTQLNAGQAEPTPGNTKDMGIFNFNNDKDNLNTMGMDTDIFPNALSYEVTANSDTSAGAFVPFTSDGYSMTYWINGTGTSYKYCSPLIPISFLTDVLKLTKAQCVVNNGGFRYTQLDSSMNRLGQKTINGGSLETDFIEGVAFIRVETQQLECNMTMNNIPTIFTNERTTQDAEETPTTLGNELKYLQNSFELRYPDADDVGKDYGYLGMPTEAYAIKRKRGTDKLFPFDVEFLGTRTIKVDNEIGATGEFIIGRILENGTSPTPTFHNFGTTVTLDDNVKAVQVYGLGSTFNTILINDVRHHIVDVDEQLKVEDPVLTPVLSQDHGLKRVIDWVGNCTDEEFVADFDKYFNRHYTLRYYLLVVLMAGVDNLGKNMMLDTWDGQIWYPRFYDIDTILSYDNSGEIKFDVDIEMEQGYWNTSSSRLWTKIRDLMHDELIEVYKDMRANGVTYEDIMHYMYDEQIAKIPQTYYNMDYDVKYAPYADEYLGKAHGDGYQHMKRWLKKRFIFCDTLYDYAPSYNNDVLTIRANTLNEMNLTIETYTPLYQHVSFYNGNMEKIKIAPGQPMTFKGFAQTETDQEVLIYGGSNIKKITGIQSMNPNSMLIGGATRLTELDISNCPILTIVNSNKANFSPHTYLNKLNMSNCPQLGGNLNVSNSPLLQEIKARNSAVTGLLLPTSLRNLKTLELPNTISSLALHDATSLDTLKFDEGVAMQSIELSNCTGITNTENFDITKIPTVTLDNSYDTEELYMSETTNLTLKNMSNLERLIYTPNSEYEEFNIDNVTSADNYTVVTSNCPKLKTFMTTAPHRESYNGDDVEYEQSIGDVTHELLDKYYTIGGYWNDEGVYDESNSFIHYVAFLPTAGMEVSFKTLPLDESNSVRVTYFHNGGFIERYLYGTEHQNEEGIIEYTLTPPPLTTEIIFVCDAPYMESCSYIEEDVPIIHKIYGDITPNTTFTANTLDLSATQFEDIKLLCTTDVYNLKVPTTMKNFYCDSAMDIDTDVIEDASYEVIHEELIEPYTTNYDKNVYRYDSFTEIYSGTLGNMSYGDLNGNTSTWQGSTDYIRIVPSTEVTVTQKTTYSEITMLVSGYDINKNYVETYLPYDTDYKQIPQTFRVADNVEYIRVQGNYSRNYEVVSQQPYTPNIIPSSANGSLIFNMYSNNTTQPTSTSPYMWDLTGLKLEDFYTYGMNNNVKASDGIVNISNIPMNYAKHRAWTTPNSAYIDISNYDANSSAVMLMNGIKLSAGDKVKLISIIRDGVVDTKYGWYWRNTVPNVDTSIGGAGYIQGTGSYYTSTQDCRMYMTFYTSNSDVPIFDVENIIINLEITKADGNILNLYLQANEYDGELVHCNPATAFHSMYNCYTIDELSDSAYKLAFTPTSITMPQRMPGYSVRLVNADITPINHPVMFYPKLTSETNAIEGKIDYSKYGRLNLTWAFGYLGGDNVTVIQPTDFILQNYHGYKVYYGLNPLIENPYVIAVFKSTNSTTKPSYRTTDRYDKYTTTIEMDGEYFITTIRTPALEYLPTSFKFDTSPGLIAVYGVNTSECTDLASLFRDCANLEYVNFASFDTSKVTLMRAMFARCYKMKVIDLRTWDMRALKDMMNAFYECNETTHIYFPSMTGGQELNMQNVFYHCEKLTLLDMTGFDASKVTNWYDMFLLAYQLTHFYPMDNISLTLDLRHSPYLTVESASSLVENLAPVTTTQTLSLSALVVNKLSAEQKASVTAKGWTLYSV